MNKKLKNRIRNMLFITVKCIINDAFNDELFFDIKDIENVLSDFGIQIYRKKGDPNSWLNQKIAKEYKVNNRKIYSVHDDVKNNLYKFPQKNKKYLKIKYKHATILKILAPEDFSCLDKNYQVDSLSGMMNDITKQTNNTKKEYAQLTTIKSFQSIINNLKKYFDEDFVKNILIVYNKDAIERAFGMYKEQLNKRQIRMPESYMRAILLNHFNKDEYKNRGGANE